MTLRGSLQLVHARAAADAQGLLATPAAILLESRPGHHHKLLAVGTPAAVAGHEAAPAAGLVQRPRSILIPALVNAHTHLDLTHIGPRPHDPAAGFMPWVDMIRRERLTEPDAIARSVQRGVALLRAGGTAAVGDIAGAVAGRPSLLAARALAHVAGGLLGVSFLEYFAMGQAADRVLAAVDNLFGQPWPAGPIRLGLQPHAPYSVGSLGFARAAQYARAGWPVCAHVAESPEERAFIQHGLGPIVDLLSCVGAWDDSARRDAALGVSPVAAALDRFAAPGLLAVHLNDLSDRDIAQLAHARARAVYCPRASAYFAAERPFGPHRYRDLLAAGVPVALGTDSIVNLPPHAADPALGGISILDELRFLYHRDSTDPVTLLAMATTHGAAALGLDPGLFTFRGPAIAGLLAIDAPPSPDNPLSALALSDAAPEWLPEFLP